ncbi:MAG: hypothetical protein EOO77_22960 [Oxalobacteraceae bacterium]|nr:MAG: hypothetical protein EOO77_22960 [Oxalobacteraceae bacterium]
MLGFGLVWHVWWLAILCLVTLIGTVIARSFVRDVHRVIPATDIARIEQRWHDAIVQARAIPREREMMAVNEGLAEVNV